MNYKTTPVISEFPSMDHSEIPSGLKVTCCSGPDSGDQSPNCPVIIWNDYIYWAYSYIDNRVGLCIVAYDESGKIIKKWDMIGTRYVYSITMDEKAKTFTFLGQAKDTIVMKWADLFLMKPPMAGTIPTNLHPVIPEGSKLDPSKGPDKWEPADECPVIEWNDFTYWPYSYIDNREAMNIVAYDTEGHIVRQWEQSGARYVYKITVDEVAETVTFRGQSDRTIVMKWDELAIENVHRWGFDETEGLIAHDSFGGINASLSPTVTRVSPGQNSPGAVHINGSDDSYVSFGTEVGQFFKNDFSVCLWFKTSETIRYFDLVGNRTAPSHGNFFCIRMTGIHETMPQGQITVEVDEDAKNYIAVEGKSHTGLNDGKWHHVAAVRNGGSLKLYIDGELSEQGTSSGVADIKNGNEFKIGRSLIMNVDRFAPDASFDSLYVCDYAFTDKEVKDIYYQ